MEEMTKGELIREGKEEEKWHKINNWTKLIGTSILLIILIIGILLKW